MILLLFIIKTLVLTDGKVLKSFNSNSIKEGTKHRILPDDSKPAERPDLKTETRKIAAEDDDGHKVIVTAKFWFVSDLTGGQANAEAQAAKYVVEMNGALERSEIAIEYRQWGSVQMLEQANAEMISHTNDENPNEKFINALGDSEEARKQLKQSADHIILIP